MVSKINHKVRCLCKICINLRKKSDERAIKFLEKYYLQAFKKGFKFSLKRNKKPKCRLILFYKDDYLINPVKSIFENNWFIKCRKCYKLKRAMPGFRLTCLDCSRADVKNVKYWEWKAWGNTTLG